MPSISSSSAPNLLKPAEGDVRLPVRISVNTTETSSLIDSKKLVADNIVVGTVQPKPRALVDRAFSRAAQNRIPPICALGVYGFFAGNCFRINA